MTLELGTFDASTPEMTAGTSLLGMVMGQINFLRQELESARADRELLRVDLGLANDGNALLRIECESLRHQMESARLQLVGMAAEVAVQSEQVSEVLEAIVGDVETVRDRLAAAAQLLLKCDVIAAGEALLAPAAPCWEGDPPSHLPSL